MPTNPISADLERMRRSMHELSSRTIRVGVLGSAGSDMTAIAAIHEYGGVITPKTAKMLAIPLVKEAKGNSPRSFDDTFIVKSKKGNVLIARDKRLLTKKGTKRKNTSKIVGPPQESELELLYALKKSVRIPERSFIRASYDAHGQEINEIIDEEVAGVITGESGLSPTDALNNIGTRAAAITRAYISEGQVNPETGEPAKSLKTQHTTLYDTGRLEGSISHVVE